MKPSEKSSLSRAPLADRIAKWITMTLSLATGGAGAYFLVRLALHTAFGAEGAYQPFPGLELPADDWTSWAMGPVLMVLGLLGWRMAAALFSDENAAS